MRKAYIVIKDFSHDECEYFEDTSELILKAFDYRGGDGEELEHMKNFLSNLRQGELQSFQPAYLRDRWSPFKSIVLVWVYPDA